MANERLLTTIKTASGSPLAADLMDGEMCYVGADSEMYIKVNGNVEKLSSQGKTVSSYLQSNIEGGYIYSKYIVDGVPKIARFGTSMEYATGVTNITTDWTNRTNLTYV